MLPMQLFMGWGGGGGGGGGGRVEAGGVYGFKD